MRRLSLLLASAASFAAFTPGAESPPADNPLLLACTYLGGSGSELVHAARIGPDGTLWIAGQSTSSDIPGATPAGAGGSNGDAFVIRIDPATRGVLSSAWIGGGGADAVIAVEFDGAGAAFVAGRTESPDFPYTAGLAGAGESRPATFVARLAPDARSFAWVYALGGSGADAPHGLCLTDGGDPVVVGRTTSVDFPWTSQLGRADGDRDAGDAFVTRLRADGSGIAFSAFLGGGGFDSAAAVVRVPGGLVVAGNSDGLDLPEGLAPLPGSTLPKEAFLAEIDQEGTQIRRSRNFAEREVAGLARWGDALVLLASTREPVPPGPDGRPVVALPPSADTAALLLEMDAATWTPFASAFFDGSGDERGLAMSLGADGTAWLAGTTTSDDLEVPGAIRPRRMRSEDAFVAAFDLADLSQTFGTYLGGRFREIGAVIAAVDDGTAWVLGSTNSPDFPTLGLSPGLASDIAKYDLFAAHVAQADRSALPSAPLGVAAVPTGTNSVRVTWTPAGDASSAVAVDRADLDGWKRIAVVDGAQTEFTDSGVIADHGYTYELQSLSDAGGSPPSGAAHAVTPATLSFAISNGRLRAGPLGFGGTLRLSGSVHALLGAPFDPRTTGFEIVFFTTFGPDTVVRVPANDPGWRTRRTRLSWKSGATRFEIDPATGAFDLRTSGHAPAVPVGDPLSAQVVGGRNAGTTSNVWRFAGRRETRTP